MTVDRAMNNCHLWKKKEVGGEVKIVFLPLLLFPNLLVNSFEFVSWPNVYVRAGSRIDTS